MRRAFALERMRIDYGETSKIKQEYSTATQLQKKYANVLGSAFLHLTAVLRNAGGFEVLDKGVHTFILT